MESVMKVGGNIIKKTLATTLSIVLMLLYVFPMHASSSEDQIKDFQDYLLEEIKAEGVDLSDEEIRKIMDQVEKDIKRYYFADEYGIDYITKTEQMLQNSPSAFSFNSLAIEEGKPVEEVILESSNPKLAAMPEGSYYFDKSIGELEFNISKDELFNIGSSSGNGITPFATAWESLGKGDILFNFDNGWAVFKWGHVAMLHEKGSSPGNSWTIEAPGSGSVVTRLNYNTAWHSDYQSRMAYTYIPSAYSAGTDIAAANMAYYFMGRPYGLNGALGDMNTVYCTELVWYAYRWAAGINLDMRSSPEGLLYPWMMYCHPSVTYYFRQGNATGMC